LTLITVGRQFKTMVKFSTGQTKKQNNGKTVLRTKMKLINVKKIPKDNDWDARSTYNKKKAQEALLMTTKIKARSTMKPEKYETQFTI
jgi:hypothetical protein